METLSWELGDGRIVQLTFTLSTDFNIDEILKIDINNILGEYLTAPTLFNTVANLRTITMEEVGKKNLQLKLAKREIYIDILKTQKPKPNKDTIDALIETNELYLGAAEELIKAEKQASMMDNLYWAMKEKCSKLENLYHKITPDEFSKDIMEKQVNNILIKIKRALIT
jgi:hypothetical protein